MSKRVLLSLIGINLLIISSGIIFGLVNYRKIIVKPRQDIPSTQIPPSATPTPDPDAPFSILLLGYGGGKHEGGRLTDSIMLARIIPRQKKINLISIPRDLWVELPIDDRNTKGHKINAAYAIGLDDRNYSQKPIEYTGPAGGGQLAKRAVSSVVGFEVDHFIALDFSGFTKFIDLLGGVNVNITRSFEDSLYPIEGSETDTCGLPESEIELRISTMSGSKLEESFSCRYETLKFEKGINRLDGNTALKYVRSRHSKEDGGDFNRAARQRNLIEAVKDKVISLNFLPKIPSTVTTLSSHLQTDIDFTKMEQLISKATDYYQYSIETLALTDDNLLVNAKSSDGQFILEPRLGYGKFDDIKYYVQTGILPTPTAKIIPSQAPKE